jgi:hypothetical protein
MKISSRRLDKSRRAGPALFNGIAERPRPGERREAVLARLGHRRRSSPFPATIAAGRLNSDALNLTEGSHPSEHLAITLPGGGEGSRFHDPILFVDDREAT